MLQTSRRHEHGKEDPATADCVHPETDSYFYSVFVFQVRQEVTQWVLILVFNFPVRNDDGTFHVCWSDRDSLFNSMQKQLLDPFF